MSDYSYKAISAAMNEIIDRQQKEMTLVSDAISGLDINPIIKMQIRDAVAKYYQPQLTQLAKMAEVAEWHQLNATK